MANIEKRKESAFPVLFVCLFFVLILGGAQGTGDKAVVVRNAGFNCISECDSN